MVARHAALPSSGNCLNLNGDKEKAKELYLEAIGVEADCIEAIYNLGACFLSHCDCVCDARYRVLLFFALGRTLCMFRGRGGCLMTCFPPCVFCRDGLVALHCGCASALFWPCDPCTPLQAW